LSVRSADELMAAARQLSPEAVFNEPWEARAFAVAVALCEAGCFQWADFQLSLSDEIARAEAAGSAAASGADYYNHWLAALTSLLERKSIVDVAELDARIAALGPPPPPQDPRTAERTGS
jgi:nitrile hydratase accessory protein